MNEIAQVAQRNVDAARSVVTSSNELLSLAERLRVTVGAKR
jgi:methyl-accepting chemotaxis protein